MDAAVAVGGEAGASRDHPGAARRGPARYVAWIDVEDDLSGYQVPAGAAAHVVVHTEHWHHFAVIRRIPPRGNSWMSYVFAEEH